MLYASVPGFSESEPGTLFKDNENPAGYSSGQAV